jgi:hypothetical protein
VTVRSINGFWSVVKGDHIRDECSAEVIRRKRWAALVQQTAPINIGATLKKPDGTGNDLDAVAAPGFAKD